MDGNLTQMSGVPVKSKSDVWEDGEERGVAGVRRGGSTEEEPWEEEGPKEVTCPAVRGCLRLPSVPGR